MNPLRAFVLFCLLMPFGYVFFSVRWEGILEAPERTIITELPRAPLWSPPEKPKHEAFESSLLGAPKDKSAGIIRVRPRLTWALLDGALIAWPISGIFGLVHLLVRKKRFEASLLFSATVFSSV